MYVSLFARRLLTPAPLFRLDVSQHMSLCRHYVRELRRSVLVATPDLEKADSKGSSAMLDNMDTPGDIPLVEAGPSGARSDLLESDEKDADHKLSEFLRTDGRNNTGHSSQNSNGSNYPERTESNDQPRTSSGTQNDSHSHSPGHTVARADIRASAEKVLYTYLLPGAEREIVLPDEMVSNIINLVEDDGRDDPEVFDPAKDYVFQAMERDAFPGFLQAKALGNLVPLSIVARLALALISFGGGFWGAFYVVLSNQPRHIRCWVSFEYFGVFTSVNANYLCSGDFTICGGRLFHYFIPVQT